VADQGSIGCDVCVGKSRANLNQETSDCGDNENSVEKLPIVDLVDMAWSFVFGDVLFDDVRVDVRFARNASRGQAGSQMRLAMTRTPSIIKAATRTPQPNLGERSRCS